MNLSPDWVDVLRENGFEAEHWSKLGDPRADDFVLMDWARANDYVVFTHDLDFGALLWLTQAESPSVIPGAHAGRNARAFILNASRRFAQLRLATCLRRTDYFG